MQYLDVRRVHVCITTCIHVFFIDKMWIYCLFLVNGLLTPSQPTCVGDMVEYNCSFQDSALQWNYNGDLINMFRINQDSSRVTVNILGIIFNISYNASNGTLTSTLQFEAREASNNVPVECLGFKTQNSNTEIIEIILNGKYCMAIF